MHTSFVRPIVAAAALCVGFVLGGPRAATVSAQSAPPFELTRANGPLVIDGVPDDAAWSAIAPLPLTVYTPVFKGTPTQRSTIRVTYDDEYFYAAGWFYDSEPARIVVNSLYRDRWNGDDALAIYIDGFNDNRTTKWFGVTAAGMRFDQLLSDDGATFNASWDTFWDARSTITDEGWFTEVRIPFSSIGFRPDANGKVMMGLTVTRLVGRNNERVTFPEIDPRFEFRRPSVAQDVVLSDLRRHTPVYVTPYVLGGAAQSVVAPSAGSSNYGLNRSASQELGLDVRYPLSGRLTLDVTVNTDFAQAEADDQQVNLDRFPLFFPERRRFFQEGSGTFDFNAGGGARLFNSRRIGIASDLSSVPIFGGARLVGQTAGWDVGALGMQARAQGTTPTESFGVLRLRRPVLNEYSSAGVMLTSYRGGDRQNTALGTDGTFRIAGNDFLTLKYAATFDSDDSSAVTASSRSLVDVNWERRVQRGLQYSVSGTWMGRDHRPELGFLQRRDYTQVSAYGNWFIYTDEHRWLRRYYPGALAFTTFRNATHVLESGTYAFWVQWDTKSGGGGWIEPKWFHENVASAFPIGDATIPVGSYDFADLQLALSMANGRKLRASVDLRAGTFYDGTRAQAILRPTWNVSKHLELGTDYQLTHLEFASRAQIENVHVVRLRIRAALDASASGNAFVQYNSTTDRLDFNVRLRYAFKEGTDLWIVFNEGLDTDRSRDVSGTESPLSLARTVLIKYSRTFGF